MESVAAWVGLSAGILIAVGVIWTKGLVPTARFVRNAVRTADVIDEVRVYIAGLPAAIPVLMEIAEQFRPNGGASLVDRTMRIEVKLGEVAILARANRTAIADLSVGLADNRTAIAALAAQLEER